MYEPGTEADRVTNPVDPLIDNPGVDEKVPPEVKPATVAGVGSVPFLHTGVE